MAPSALARAHASTGWKLGNHALVLSPALDTVWPLTLPTAYSLPPAEVVEHRSWGPGTTP